MYAYCKTKKKDIATFVYNGYFKNGIIALLCAIGVVILWKLDLQLPMQSLPITTNIVSSNHTHGKVYFFHFM